MLMKDVETVCSSPSRHHLTANTSNTRHICRGAEYPCSPLLHSNCNAAESAGRKAQGYVSCWLSCRQPTCLCGTSCCPKLTPAAASLARATTAACLHAMLHNYLMLSANHMPLSLLASGSSNSTHQQRCSHDALVKVQDLQVQGPNPTPLTMLSG